MKKYKIKNLIKEEGLRDQPQVSEVFEMVKEFDAQSMEDFLNQLSQHFTSNSETLTNINANKVGFYLRAASRLLGQRTGN
jgi:hypothetical protein